MASSKAVGVMIICMVIILASSPHASAQISGAIVYLRLAPCVGYVQNGGDEVPTSCCDGLKSFLGGTKADRQSVCSCLKSVAAGVDDLTYAAEIPTKCDLDLPYAISPDFDCSTVN